MEPSVPAKGSGVCMMSISWREKQHPSFISYISSFLAANSYRLNFLPIVPDFIFNNRGVSVAFVFEMCWDCEKGASVLARVEKLKAQFKHLYVVVVVPTREQNDSFNQSYLAYNFELGRPTFVPVHDPEMRFEKIVNISHARGGACDSVLGRISASTAIPGIDNHDANALAQAFGSIEAIAKASAGSILQSTDLSSDKAKRIFRFFRDPQYYLRPKIH